MRQAPKEAPEQLRTLTARRRAFPTIALEIAQGGLDFIGLLAGCCAEKERFSRGPGLYPRSTMGLNGAVLGFGRRAKGFGSEWLGFGSGLGRKGFKSEERRPKSEAGGGDWW